MRIVHAFDNWQPKTPNRNTCLHLSTSSSWGFNTVICTETEFGLISRLCDRCTPMPLTAQQLRHNCILLGCQIVSHSVATSKFASHPCQVQRSNSTFVALNVIVVASHLGLWDRFQSSFLQVSLLPVGVTQPLGA
jgi:hypothetical protein